MGCGVAMSLDEAKQVTAFAAEEDDCAPAETYRRYNRILDQAGNFKGNTESYRIKAVPFHPPAKAHKAWWHSTGLGVLQHGSWAATNRH